MRQPILALLAAFTWGVVALPAWADDRSDLLALEARWNKAVWEKDAAALEGILTPDFIIITASGATGGKKDLIGSIVASKAQVQPFVCEDVVVRVYGDTAVLTGRFTQTIAHNGASQTAHYRYTDVYVRRSGAWRAVSAQATTAPLPTKP